jgi:hypothetical protein
MKLNGGRALLAGDSSGIGHKAARQLNATRCRSPAVFLLLPAGCFLLLRLPLFFDPALHLGWNSDAAVMGMMAKAIAQGRGFPLFFWQQSYLGPLTSYVAAPLIWFMHPMRALRLAASLEVLGGIIFYWFALRREFDERVANVAALWLAIGPSYFMLFSIATVGGEPLFLLSGIVFWIGRRNWFVLGLLAGFGWWIHQGIIFAVASVVLSRQKIVVLRWPRSVVAAAIAIVISIDVLLGALVSLGVTVPAFYFHDPLLEPLLALALFVVRPALQIDWKSSARFVLGALIGYLPVIIGTLRGAVRNTYGLSVPGMPLRGTLEHLVTLLRSDLWLFVGIGASVLVVPFFIAAMLRRPALEPPLIVIILCAIFYLFSERAHPGSVRYIVAALPMVYAFAAREMRKVHRGLILIVAITLLVPRISQILDVANGRGEIYDHLPGGFDPRPAIRAIEVQHYTICYADYWIGYKLQWVSDERIHFIPYHSLDRTRAASRIFAATPGPKCYVDTEGRVSRFQPNPLDAIIQRNAREHLRRMGSPAAATNPD